MIDPEMAIRRAWNHLVDRRLSASPREASVRDEIIEDLLRRYAEPHRHYHTAEHVMRALHHVDVLVADDRGDVDHDAVSAAALFHDAIYATHPGEGVELSNEAMSARLATDALNLVGWPDDRVRAVAALIEATETHQSTSAAAAILLDADLAVLGAGPARYADYVHGIRAEYSHVSDEQWRVGRAAVLRGFLARPTIFATSYMAGEREAQARSNIAAELSHLTTPAP